MFHAYAGMTMEQRDAIVGEWMKSMRLDEVPATPSKI